MRTATGLPPPGVHERLRDLVALNSNDGNPFDDSHYVGDVLEAFCASACRAEEGPADVRLKLQEQLVQVLEAVVRALNIDRLTPSFHNELSCGAIRSLARLQEARRIAPQSELLSKLCMYGHYDGQRIAALRAIAGIVHHGLGTEWGIPELRFLLTLACDDPSPAMRRAALVETTTALAGTPKAQLDVLLRHPEMRAAPRRAPRPALPS